MLLQNLSAGTAYVIGIFLIKLYDLPVNFVKTMIFATEKGPNSTTFGYFDIASIQSCENSILKSQFTMGSQRLTCKLIGVEFWQFRSGGSSYCGVI